MFPLTSILANRLPSAILKKQPSVPNLEAADEIARQLRLRDLAGLIVIDFIDMESRRHNMQVERRLKDALKQDRARIQIGRISHFGLLEMSRQRLHPSLAETMLTPCPHCHGTGTIRGTESNALHVLRTIEEEAARHQNATLYVSTLPEITLYMLNAKREWLGTIEAQHNVTITFKTDATLSDNPSDNKVRIEWVGTQRNDGEQPAARNSSRVSAPEKIRTIEIVEGRFPLLTLQLIPSWKYPKKQLQKQAMNRVAIAAGVAETGDATIRAEIVRSRMSRSLPKMMQNLR